MDHSIKTGDIIPIPDAEHNAKVIELARWAIEEYDKETNAMLKFKKVLSAKKQIVDGIMYYIILEAFDGPTHVKVYEANVLVQEKPWTNTEKLVEFKQLQPNA